MIFNVEYPSAASCRVPTEDVICKNLIKNKNMFSDDCTLINCNWTKCINGWGIESTQKILNDITKVLVSSGRVIEKSIFICQHIFAEKLFWPSKLVFSPHATKKNKFIAIPHLACNFPTLQIDKVLLASFMGSFETHWTRPLLKEFSSSSVSIIDSGTWYHYNPDEYRKNAYEKLLAISKFTLCPRGTGPSTIRIWEALAAGSIPVIISNSLVLPNIDCDWRAVVVFVSEQNVTNTLEVLNNYSNSDISKMSNLGMKIFYKYCTIENIHNFIFRQLNG